MLAAVAIPTFGKASSDAKTSTDLANAKIIANAATISLAEGKLKDSIGKGLVEVNESSELKEQLQSIPKTSDKNNFYIKIDNGNVKVYTSSDGSQPIYPQ